MQYATIAKDIAQPLTRLLLLLPLALLGLTAEKAMIPYIVGLLVTCLLLLYYLNHLFPLMRRLQTARRDVAGILRFSLPAYFSTMLDSFGPSVMTILLGSMNTLSTVGIYAVAVQIGMAGSMFNQSIGTASSPIVSGLDGQGDDAQMAHFYQITTKWMFTVNLPFFLIILLLSEPILTVFGSEFVAGATALKILSFAYLVAAAAGISDGILAMTGNTLVRLGNSIAMTVLTLGLGYLLIPNWGVIGAALAILVVTAIVNSLRVLEVFFFMRMTPYNQTFFKPVLAGLVAFILGWMMRQIIHTGTNLALAVVNASVILGAYCCMIYFWKLSPEDQAVIAHLQKRIAAVFSKI